jgi:hypothetical protein
MMSWALADVGDDAGQRREYDRHHTLRCVGDVEPKPSNGIVKNQSPHSEIIWPRYCRRKSQ